MDEFRIGVIQKYYKYIFVKAKNKEEAEEMALEAANEEVRKFIGNGWSTHGNPAELDLLSTKVEDK